MTAPLVVAAVLLAGVLGLAAALPLLTTPVRGGRAVGLLLSLDTGAVLVAGLLLAGAAGRSWVLIGDPPTIARPDGVLQVSRLDGDGNFFALLIVVIGLLTLFGALVLGLSARAVQGTQPGDAALVQAVLWIQVLIGVSTLGRVLLGAGGQVDLLLTAHLPLSVGALWLHHRRHRLAP